MHEIDVAGFLANLLVILLSAKVFGELAERWGQPAVLGELLGGVVLGFGVFSFFQPDDPALTLMAEFGVVLLLFETGLESDLGELLKVGAVSLAVASVGVALPFVFGYGVMWALGKPGMEAVFVGAALTATSVGITARVLSDMGKLTIPEARIVLGAAVIDDVVGVIILSVVQGLAVSGVLDWGSVARIAFLAVAFLAGALVLGQVASRYLLKVVEKMQVRGVLIAAALCFALALALLAKALGTALIVGAFTAGILLAGTERKADIRLTLKPVADIFVPVFFVMVGAKVQLGVYNPMAPDNWSMLGLASLLILAAVIGKLLCGWVAWGQGLNRWGIGFGMVPRGEVGLIFAQIGLASGAIDPALYAAIVGMVVVTTFIAPPLLKKAFT